MSENGDSRGNSRGRHSRHSRDPREAREAREANGSRGERRDQSARRASHRAPDRRERRRSEAAGGAGAAAAASSRPQSRGSGSNSGAQRPANSRGGQGKKKKQFGGPAPVKAVLGILAALMLGVGGYANANFGDLDDLGGGGNMELGDQKDGATDILLIGADSRTDAQGNPLTQKQIDMLRAGEEETTNTDTIILLRVPNDGSSATAVSMPRDTYVHTEDFGNQKINAVYAQAQTHKTNELAESGKNLSEKDIALQASSAGRETLADAVGELSGITIDHFAEVGMLGFVDLTDAVGGVDVCLNEAVDEPLSGANFSAGRQTLDGQDALSFVRQRHELPRGDLDRITRQQAYLASLTNKVLSSSTWTSPSKLNDLTSAVKQSVMIDEGWDIMGLAQQMQGLSGGNVDFQTIPVTSIDGTADDGSSVVTIDKNQVNSFFEDMLGGSDKNKDEEKSEDSDDSSDSGESWEDIGDYDPAESTVSVYNASEVSGLASRVGDLVSGSGYGMGELGNSAETGVSESQVNVADTEDPAARGLAKQLGGLEVIEDPSLEEGQINVTLSGTYDGPGTSDSGVDEPLPAIGDESASESSGSGDGSSGDSGSEENVGTPGTDATGGDVLEDGAGSENVGTPGTPEESSSATEKEDIDAGGDGPMCVN